MTPWYADGQFRTDNYQLPPTPHWGFQPDISNWQDSSTAEFATLYDDFGRLHGIAEFCPISGALEDLYETTTTGDISTSTAEMTPVDSVLRILDYVQTEQNDDGDSNNSGGGPILYIYEGWMDAGGNVPDDISETTTAQRNAYYAENAWDSNYHNWWIQLMDRVRLERPNARLAWVPIAPILMDLLSTYFPAASFFDLFEDSAPHGRPMVYFWASVILYLHMAPPPTNHNNTNNHNTDLVVAVVERLVTASDMLLLPNVPISTVVESIARQIVVPTDTTITPSPPLMPSTITTTSPSQPTLTMSPASPVTLPTTSMPSSIPSKQPQQPQQLVDNSCCDQSIPEEGADIIEVTTTTCSTVEYCNESMENCQGDCEGRWVIQQSDERTTPRPSTTPAPPFTIPSLPPMTDNTTIVAQNCCEKEGSCSTIDYCNEAQLHCLNDCEGTWVVLTLNGEEESTVEGTTTTFSSAPSSNAKTSSASRLTGLPITLMGWLLLVVGWR